jgi:hypothetical protein
MKKKMKIKSKPIKRKVGNLKVVEPKTVSVKFKPLKKLDLIKIHPMHLSHIQELEKAGKLSSHHKKPLINRKNWFIVIGLPILVILIIIACFVFIPQNGAAVEKENPVIANFQMAAIEKKSFDLLTKILDLTYDQQLSIIEQHYSEVGLDKSKMDACLVKNDYTSIDTNLENAKIFSKIQDDVVLARYLNLIEAPGIFVNGYFVSGATNYDTLKKYVDFAINDSVVNFNYSNKAYVSNDFQKASVTVIYNGNNKETKDNAIKFVNDLRTPG